MEPASRGADRVAMTLDGQDLVANAGFLLAATVAKKLQLEELLDLPVHLDRRTGGREPGRKMLTLVHAMAGGATHIDHADLLRAGSTEGCSSTGAWRPPHPDAHWLGQHPAGHSRFVEELIARVRRSGATSSETGEREREWSSPSGNLTRNPASGRERQGRAGSEKRGASGSS